jgi:SnoaL-like domain
MTDPALQALLDKQEIAELLTRYLRSVDRGDVATLRACYLPGATEDHGGLFAGPAQDYVDSVAAALTHPRARTSHNMTNLLIALDGDVATAESYCVTFARIKADGQYFHSFTGARMIDRLERPGRRPEDLGHRAPSARLGLEPRRPRGRTLDARPARSRPLGAAPQRQIPRRPRLRPPLTGGTRQARSESSLWIAAPPSRVQ